MKFEIHKADDSQFYFRIVARNGKILAHSETYTRKRDAVRAVARIQNESHFAPVVIA